MNFILNIIIGVIWILHFWIPTQSIHPLFKPFRRQRYFSKDINLTTKAKPNANLSPLDSLYERMGLDYSDQAREVYNPYYGYEPYWPGGDWIVEDPYKGRSTTEMPTVCGEECNYMYKEVGEVCAHHVTHYGWADTNRGSYNYFTQQDIHDKAFHTIKTFCEFLNLQCKDLIPDRWVLAHTGKCLTHEDYWPIVGYPHKIVDRIKSNRERLDSVMDSMDAKAFQEN